MTQPTDHSPFGIHPAGGISHKLSPFSVAETVDRLTDAITGPGAKLFTLVDHSGEAESTGQFLRDTKLLIFGNPAAGTPVMEASPLAALDLPLKVLVWQDDGGSVWMSYLEADWLADRHGIPSDLAKVFSAAGMLAKRLAEE
jgi:uncharacterized protein (DUF302 family)